MVASSFSLSLFFLYQLRVNTIKINALLFLVPVRHRFTYQLILLVRLIKTGARTISECFILSLPLSVSTLSFYSSPGEKGHKVKDEDWEKRMEIKTHILTFYWRASLPPSIRKPISLNSENFYFQFLSTSSRSSHAKSFLFSSFYLNGKKSVYCLLILFKELPWLYHHQQNIQYVLMFDSHASFIYCFHLGRHTHTQYHKISIEVFFSLYTKSKQPELWCLNSF